MSKKAQVTVFIIIGLVLLFLGSLFYIVSSPLEDIPTLDVEPTEIAQETAPINEYVLSCLDRVSKDAIKFVAGSGGYYNTSEYLTYSIATPTDTEAVPMSPGSPLILPYWWHMKSPNTCERNCNFGSERPPLYESSGELSVERSIARYIEDHLELCLFSYSPFLSYFDDLEFSEEKKVEVMIRENDVYIELNMEVLSSRGELEGRLTDFYNIQNVNFYDLYNISSEIVNIAQRDQFLERALLEWLVIFSELDSEKLPPMSDVEWSPHPSHYWSKTNVKENIKNIIAAYTPFLQVYRSFNYEDIRSDSIIGNSMYVNGMTIFMEEPQFRYKIKFYYLDWWPIYLDMNCEGELCTGTSFSALLDFLPFMGVQNYNFVYDISHPVMVEITDVWAYNYEGLTMRFMLESNIRNNDAFTYTSNPLDISEIPGGSMFCDIDKRTSRDISLDIRDSVTNKHIDKVNILYTCADETCSIGEFSGNDTINLPVCLGGLITFYNEDYLRTSKYITTKLNDPQEIDLELHKFVTINATARKKKFMPPNTGHGSEWSFVDIPVELENDERAFVTLKRIPEQLDAAHSATFIIDSSSKISEIKLVPGDYEINMQILKNKTYHIPERTETEGTWPFEQTIEYPEVNLSAPWPSGGAIFNQTTNVTITKQDLEKSMAVFYGASAELFEIVPESRRRIEDLEVLGKAEEVSALHRQSLLPRFI